MEYLVFVPAMAAFVLLIFGLEAYRAKKEEKNFIARLREDYLKLSDKTYRTERFEKIDSYFRRHQEKGQLDDITWNDLGMDGLFKRMNYTLSATGEEYLYYTLRTPRLEGRELERFEEKVGFFDRNPEKRVRFQFCMSRLGYTGKYSLYDYIDNLDYLGERSNRKHICMDLLFLPLAALCGVNFPLGFAGLAALTIYNIITYFKEKGEIDPYIISFAYVIRLLGICDELEKVGLSGCAEELERIRIHKKKLASIRRNSFWVMNASSVRGGNASGDIIGILMDYIRMTFHVDLIKFNSMLRILRQRTEDVDELIGTVGYLETAVAVWIFRQSLENGWCRPEFVQEGEVELEEAYHPMLAHPVKNSITARRGVLLTGSNASGKSTFLKTVALGAILAQSINTCAAERYRAPFFRIYTSMALRDDLTGGESYYIVEIKALKRILEAAASGEGPILCAVDEVLRGTNTVERIAASTQILRSLGGSSVLAGTASEGEAAKGGSAGRETAAGGSIMQETARKGMIFCFAATHDIELTDLLQEEFDNYHFEEDVQDGDICFNYRLQAGKASSRNAIRLLELMGYDREMTARAFRQAERFLETGSWR